MILLCLCLVTLVSASENTGTAAEIREAGPADTAGRGTAQETAVATAGTRDVSADRIPIARETSAVTGTSLPDLTTVVMIFAVTAIAAGLVVRKGKNACSRFSMVISDRSARLLIAGFGFFALVFAVGSLSLTTWIRAVNTGGAAGVAIAILMCAVPYLAWSSALLAVYTAQRTPAILILRIHPVVSVIAWGLLISLIASVFPDIINRWSISALIVLFPLSALAGWAALRSILPVSDDDREEGGKPPVPAGAGEDEEATRIASSTVTQACLPPALQEKYSDVMYVGKGGLGRVFRAQRRTDGKTVAVKVPISFDELTGKSFMREMRIWETLRHPNIIELYSLNILPVPYVEMEYARESLANLEIPLPPEEAVRIVLGVARGVAHAHANGVIHRDIKPQNILLSGDGTPKLTDWGLGKVLDDGAKETSITGFSLKYAAPEQIAPNTYGKTDERCDIYQTGIVLYELLTGEPAIPGDGGLGEVSAAILHHIPAPPSSFRSYLAPFDTILKKCLEKDPENRYRSIEDLIAALISVQLPVTDTGKSGFLE
ncbi:MAG: hypothetical protein APR53_08355 [Methanoculleus sp. SDB]|nr:MAG: hypothetical protein APR53_08355 [Methanoculleus sp. SDB]